MQTIRLGLALDGQTGWQVHDAVGQATLGPMAMLTTLETQLGLLRLPVPQAERVLQMRRCLQLTATGQRFYERSLAIDELGTAACLLAWRDNWYENGWGGQVLETGELPLAATSRLLDMAAVECLAREQVALCAGQRLAAVALVLVERGHQISHVSLVDPITAWPLAWQRVLALLPCAATPSPQCWAAQGTLLAEVQQALLTAQAGGRPAPLVWRDDGSLLVASADSRLAAAQWLARQLVAGDRGHAVVAPMDGALLDAALAASGRPRLGLAQASACRPALQLLPLALRLLWAPLDCHALLEFLTLAVNPIADVVRRRIAEHLAESPGIGGTAWRRLIAGLGTRHAGAMDAVAIWIEPARHHPADQAPLAAVHERVARLAGFFSDGLLAQDQGDAWRAACQAGLAQTSAMLQALQRLLDQGQQRIAPEPLERLVALATGRGSDHPLLQAQAGAQACVTDPAALIEPFDQVSWWPLAADGAPPPPAWSRQELKCLLAAGVAVPDTAARQASRAMACLRPVLLARQRLTLVLPCQGLEPHPLWLLIHGLVKGIPVRACEQVLRGPPVNGTSATLPCLPLPGRRRWWQLPAGAPLAWPAAASYTSLELLLFNPFHWLLAYPARLRMPALLRLPDDFRLLGNLAHLVVERLYLAPGSTGWAPAQVGTWFDEHLDALVDEEAALLRMPGRRAELESFRLRLRDSLLGLHRHLQAAGVQSIESEKALAANTAIGPVRGSCDLLLTLADRRQVVIDMKWSGLDKYRRKLQSQSFLQLAIYSELQHRSSGCRPEVGYYVLREGELLTPAAGLFPGLRPVPLPANASAELWQRAVATWHWRKAQLDAGEVELVMADMAATDRSIPQPGALAIETLPAQYNPFVHLAGWEAS